MNKPRVKSVDVMRGFAVLWMVTFQIIDFFSIDLQTYHNTWCSFLDFVNWLTIFMFVSGLSVWLMVNKRLSSGISKWKILIHGLKRYTFYIFLGFILCLWCFGLETFLELNEILVAIGIYAFVTLCLLLTLFGKEWIFVPLAFAVYALSFWFKDVLKFQVYPFYMMLPLFFAGAFSAKLITEKSFKKLLLFESPLLIIIIILAFVGDSFSYAGNSPGFIIFNVFLSSLLFAIIEKLQHTKILDMFSFAGRNALFFYVFHFAVWFKLAVSLNITHTYNWPTSILLTCLTVAIIFPFADLKSKLQQIFRRTTSNPKPKLM